MSCIKRDPQSTETGANKLSLPGFNGKHGSPLPTTQVMPITTGRGAGRERNWYSTRSLATKQGSETTETFVGLRQSLRMDCLPSCRRFLSRLEVLEIQSRPTCLPSSWSPWTKPTTIDQTAVKGYRVGILFSRLMAVFSIHCRIDILIWKEGDFARMISWRSGQTW